MRTTRQASPPPVVPGIAESLPPAAPQVPAPPHVARFDIKQKRDQTRPSLLLPATLIAISSAALAGGVVWWFAQPATPTAPLQPATAATPSPATTTAAAAPASAGPTVGNAATAETAAVVSPPVSATALAALPVAASPASARGTTKPQPAKSASATSADLAKAIANVDPAAGPVLSGSGHPVVPPGPGPSDLTPSSGAVQAAVGSVLGNARNCVAGDREASRARVIFDSSGAVSAVAVSGPAAGTPAEACIKAALSKARVAPFQKPNYSVDTTIRP